MLRGFGNKEVDDMNRVLECSSRGDKRFSALYAKLKIKGVTHTIEEWY